MKVLAKIISYLFHPLLGATYIYIALMFLYPELVRSIGEEYYWRFISSVFVMTFVVPGLSALMLVKTGFTSNLHMETLQDRRWPFIFTTFVYGTVTVFFFRIFQSDPYIAVVMAFITLNMLLLGAISFLWKISIHASAVGGIVAFYIVSSYLSAEPFPLKPVLVLLPMAGAVMSARLALNSHNIWQIIAGFCLGLLTGLSSLTILSNG